MQINLTADAIEYLKQKRIDTITIDMKETACWLSAGLPEVYLGKQLDSFNEHLYGYVNVNGIDVYYYNQMDTSNGKITVCLTKFLFFKSLEVKGIELY